MLDSRSVAEVSKEGTSADQEVLDSRPVAEVSKRGTSADREDDRKRKQAKQDLDAGLSVDNMLVE